MTAAAGVYLRTYLEPLRSFLEREQVTDLYVNRPGELWIETLGGAIERHELQELTDTLLARLASQVAAYASQGLNREHPLLSSSLPDGSRIQVVLPPASKGSIILSIRKHLALALSLNDYEREGAFGATRYIRDPDQPSSIDEIKRALHKQDFASAIRQAVRARLNILVSGGTSTGKTTFLGALIDAIPSDERLITIEDTPELRVDHPNTVSLLAVRGALGEAQVTADDLVTASLRMRPDRILLGELRGREAFAFLRAVNTGHPGSMTTIHADSPAGAVEQLALLALQAGSNLSREDVLGYVRGTIGMYVQLAREGGRRFVQEVALGARDGDGWHDR